MKNIINNEITREDILCLKDILYMVQCDDEKLKNIGYMEGHHIYFKLAHALSKVIDIFEIKLNEN